MKSMNFFRAALASLVVGGLFAGSARAELFSEIFDSGASSSNFLVTQIPGSVDTITFGYDYSANLIPEAPGSASLPGVFAATRGLFIAANDPPLPATTGAINGINVTAASGGVAINFAQDITMRFDMWLNLGSIAASSTEQALFGINTDGLGVNSRTGTTQTGADGVWYHIATEGGYGATSTTNNSRDYVNYINNTAPASGRLDNGQAPFLTLFPTSSPAAGVPANSWVSVEISEIGGNVRMSMNGTTVFDVANTGPTSGSVFLGYQDPFSGSLSGPDAFVVFDNLSVSAVPEPSSIALVGLGVVGIVARRRQVANSKVVS
jgi:hypothetical protein